MSRGGKTKTPRKKNKKIKKTLDKSHQVWYNKNVERESHPPLRKINLKRIGVKYG